GFGPTATNKYVTTYFRRSFLVAAPALYTNLVLRLLRDDGAIIYLNAAEVFRSNMPTGAVTYSTYASTVVGGTDETTFFLANVSPGFLVSGVNVLAVELHQGNATSSDLSFDLELSGDARPRPPPSLALARDNARMILSWPDALFGFRLQSSTNLGLPAWLFRVEPVGSSNGNY